MIRREFLLTGLALGLGCSRRDGRSSVADRATFAERIAAGQVSRQQHLDLLARCRVPSRATRTTPSPAVDLLSIFPELKPLGKMAMRLHPRFSDEPSPEQSKLGGQFLWPTSEPWPRDAEWDVPLAPHLQLRVEDAPPQLTFRPGSDLLQVLVCPLTRKPSPEIQLHWRKVASVGSNLATLPEFEHALPGLLPVPCRLFPERVMEYPDWNTLSQTAMREKIEGWKPSGANSGVIEYSRVHSSAPGSKAGGYPRWSDSGTPPACSNCKWGMDYLLTIAHEEWDTETQSRWQPIEERQLSDEKGYRSAAGLDRTILVFVCRRCEHWPTRGIVA